VTTKPHKSVLRLPKKHRGAADQADQVDVLQLLAQQSLRDAIVGGIIVIILFSLLWAMLSTLLDRIFPWMTVLLGNILGLVIRRAGRGLDWRFPVLAAGLTLAGAVAANVIVAAAFTADELGVDTFTILRAVTSMTWPVFFDEVVSAADIVYAVFGAGAAAFYANRRLLRSEYSALRKWREQQATADSDRH
jgi:hypothetical protein